MGDCILLGINSCLLESKTTVNNISERMVIETEYCENKLPARLLPIGELPVSSVSIPVPLGSGRRKDWHIRIQLDFVTI